MSYLDNSLPPDPNYILSEMFKLFRGYPRRNIIQELTSILYDRQTEFKEVLSREEFQHRLDFLINEFIEYRKPLLTDDDLINIDRLRAINNQDDEELIENTYRSLLLEATESNIEVKLKVLKDFATAKKNFNTTVVVKDSENE